MKVADDQRLDGKSFLVTFLLMCISFSILSPSGAATADVLNQSFEWYYRGLRWTWSLAILRSLYETYKSVSISDRSKSSLTGYSFLVTTQDDYVKLVADKLHEASVQRGYGAYDEVSLVLAFIQSLPYTEDSVTTGHDDYPRFPIETLVDYGGDCEDTSILFATLMLILNYDAIFISPPRHCAVGVRGTDLQGYYWIYNNRTYYYCETTGDNFGIGDIPDEYEHTSAHLFAIDEGEQYVPSQNLSPMPNTLIFCFALGLGALVFGGLYILIRSTKVRKDGETSAKHPPAPPPSLAHRNL